MSNDYIKGLLSKKIKDIKSKNFNENKVFDMIRAIKVSSSEIFRNIIQYTKNVPDLEFSTVLLLELIEKFIYGHFALKLNELLKIKKQDKISSFRLAKEKI